jgi:O-6-methylguanine DNA methyltransferase
MRRLLRLHYGTIVLSGSVAPTATGESLAQYFAGDLTALDAIPVATGGTTFQRSVWRALRCIPHGTVVSYGELARQIGCPKTLRAVGAANGANPIGLVVPCHRVIGLGEAYRLRRRRAPESLAAAA